ncbi:hypothetical protein Tco_0814131 [Tanacetum coccineum]
MVRITLYTFGTRHDMAGISSKALHYGQEILFPRCSVCAVPWSSGALHSVLGATRIGAWGNLHLKGEFQMLQCIPSEITGVSFSGGGVIGVRAIFGNNPDLINIGLNPGCKSEKTANTFTVIATILLWNVAGAFAYPKGMRRLANVPSLRAGEGVFLDSCGQSDLKVAENPSNKQLVLISPANLSSMCP